MKLRSKLSITFILLSLLPLVTALALSLWHSSNQAHKLSIESAQSTINTTAKKLNGYFLSRKNEMLMLAHPPLVKTVDFMQMRPYLIQEKTRLSATF